MHHPLGALQERDCGKPIHVLFTDEQGEGNKSPGCYSEHSLSRHATTCLHS